jgi:hypothetical protein
MATQPPQDPRRMMWFDDQSRYWRVERAGGR